MAFGVLATTMGPTYNLGTLMHMGPGFMPTALGILLILLGITIAGSAVATPYDEHEDRLLPEHPQWWAWMCILLGPVAFMVFGTIGGLIPATFSCVFVSALGDKTATWRGTIVLCITVTAMGVFLFSYLLQVPMPVLAWRLR